jgi:ABC-2 type transport system permease protein
MRAAFWLALKDLRLLTRDKVALFWVLGFPLVFALFLGAVLHAGLRGEQAPVAVVVASTATAHQPLGEGLRRESRLAVTEEPFEQARERVRRGQAVAYVEPLPGHGARLGVDPSRAVEAAFVQQIVAATLAASQPEMASMRAAPTVQTLSVSRASAHGPREAEYVYPAAILWALIGCSACFAISMVTERTQGTLLRLVAAPIDGIAILGGKALACLLSCLAVVLALSFTATFVFGVTFERPLAVVVTLLSATLCFVGITMLLSLLGRTEQAVAGAGWAVLILMAMLGGGMVPLSFMPDWLLSASHFSPAKWSILALEGATWRQFSYRELAAPCGVLLAIAVTGFATGASVLTRTRT